MHLCIKKTSFIFSNHIWHAAKQCFGHNRVLCCDRNNTVSFLYILCYMDLIQVGVSVTGSRKKESSASAPRLLFHTLTLKVCSKTDLVCIKTNQRHRRKLPWLVCINTNQIHLCMYKDKPGSYWYIPLCTWKQQNHTYAWHFWHWGHTFSTLYLSFLSSVDLGAAWCHDLFRVVCVAQE